MRSLNTCGQPVGKESPIKAFCVYVHHRLVEWTSVHEVLKSSGQQLKVPMDVCRIIHVRVALRGSLTLKQLNEDKRLWDFQEKLIPSVDKALRRAGLLPS